MEYNPLDKKSSDRVGLQGSTASLPTINTVPGRQTALRRQDLMAVSIGSVCLLAATWFIGGRSALAFVALKAGTYVVAPLNGAGLKAVAGAEFGALGGALSLVLAEGIGAAVNYMVGYSASTRFEGLRRRAERLPACPQTTSRMAWLRFAASPAWDFISYGAGVCGWPARRFAAGTFVGSLPSAALWASAGLLIGEAAAWTLTAVVAVGGVCYGFWLRVRRR